MTRGELKQLIREVIEEVRYQDAPFTVNGKLVDIKSIEIDGIDRNDYPDFADAYISAADFQDGTPLNDNEVDQLNNMAGEWVNSKIHDEATLYLMKDTKQIIRELVEEVLDEMTGTASISGGMGPPKRLDWGRKKTKTGKDATGVSGYTVVPGHEEKSTVEEEEEGKVPVVRRNLEEGFRAYKKHPMRGESKISYGIREAKKMLGEVEYLLGICERLKTEGGYSTNNLWERTRPDMLEIHKRLKEIAKRINRMRD